MSWVGKCSRGRRIVESPSKPLSYSTNNHDHSLRSEHNYFIKVVPISLIIPTHTLYIHRLTEEQSRSLHIEPTTKTKEVLRGTDIGNRVVQYGDEWERLRQSLTDDQDFQDFVENAVRSSDGRRASETAFETFTTIADQVLEVGDTGLGELIIKVEFLFLHTILLNKKTFLLINFINFEHNPVCKSTIKPVLLPTDPYVQFSNQYYNVLCTQCL